MVRAPMDFSCRGCGRSVGHAETCNVAAESHRERLTQQQHSILCAVDDWKAAYEVAAALYPGGSTAGQRTSVAKNLLKLRDRYLVRFAASNATYKITDAGRKQRSGE